MAVPGEGTCRLYAIHMRLRLCIEFYEVVKDVYECLNATIGSLIDLDVKI